MKKIITFAVFLLLILPGFAVVSAEENRGRDIATSKINQNLIQRVGNVGQKAKESFQDIMSDDEGFLENSAENNFGTKTKERIRNLVQERKGELQEKRQKMLQNKQQNKVRLSGQRKERVDGLMNNMFLGFSNSANRLDGIFERLELVIENQEELGNDMSEARNKLVEVKPALESVAAEIEAIKEELQEAVAGEISKEYIRDLVSSAKESIRGAHESLREVISEINS